MRKLFLVLVALLSACAAPAPAATPVLRAPVETPLPAPSVTSALPTAPSSTQATLALTIPPVATNVRVTDTNEYEFPQLLPFDGIPPVYDPQFASAADASLLDDELVMGIALHGEAKAYPVTVLRFREMVDDELAGIPILVTWRPICYTGLVHDRRIDGVAYTFWNAGALFMNAMTWYDHETRSIWSQRRIVTTRSQFGFLRLGVERFLPRLRVLYPVR